MVFLYGAWIDATDKVTMLESIEAMLAASPESNRKNGQFMTIVGFGSITLSEYQSLESVAAMAGLIQECGQLAVQVIEYADGDVEAAGSLLEESYQGCYDILEGYLEQFMKDTGVLSDIPSTIAP